LNVIADQVSKYAEVRKILSESQTELTNKLTNLQLKKRHSAIDPDDFLSNVRRTFENFLSELDASESNQPDVSDEDRIRDTIDSLFDGKMGQPLSATDLEALYAEGKVRYEQKRPPGYLDIGKSRSDEVYFRG